MATLGPRKYSERLGIIDPEQLQKACDVFGLGALRRAESASAGLWGQNILLSTAEGDFVLRGNPQSPEQFRKERVVAAAINERSLLPVPWPYHLSNDTEIFGWPFAVMPLLPGTMGSTIWDAGGRDERLDLAASHGKALALLHQVTFNAAGPYDPKSEMFAEVDDFGKWTLQRIESLRELCRSADGLTADDERYIDMLIESCSDAMSEPFVPVLVHHDFSLANTNYELASGAYRAAGVFDLGEAHVGDGEEDLVRFLFRRKREQRDAFVKAYTHERPLRPGARDRLALYALADFLFIWEVSKRITNWFGDAQFIDTAKEVIGTARMMAD